MANLTISGMVDAGVLNGAELVEVSVIANGVPATRRTSLQKILALITLTKGDKGDPGTPADTSVIAAMQQNITTLQSQVSALQQTSANLQSRVTALEQGSGSTQPGTMTTDTPA